MQVVGKAEGCGERTNQTTLIARPLLEAERLGRRIAIGDGDLAPSRIACGARVDPLVQSEREAFGMSVDFTCKPAILLAILLHRVVLLKRGGGGLPDGGRALRRVPIPRLPGHGTAPCTAASGPRDLWVMAQPLRRGL